MSYERMKDADGRFIKRRTSAGWEYKYRIRFWIGGRDGKQCCRHRWLRTDIEAAQYEKREQGKTLDAIRWLESAERFCEAKTYRTDKYLDAIRFSVKTFASDCGNLVVEDTSLRVFSDWVLKRAKETSGKTANRDRQQIICVARWLRQQGLIREIPFEHAATADHKPNPRVPMDPKRLKAHLEALPEHVRLPVEMMAFTGARSSAICNLRETDVHDAHILLHEKGGIERTILLDDVLRDIIDRARAHKTRRNRISGYVFITSKGSGWDYSSIGQQVRKHWKKAKLIATGLSRPHVLHELRHMFATEAGRRYGADMVRAGLGHLCRQTSERYVHPDIQAADEVGRTVRKAIKDSMDSDDSTGSASRWTA